MDNRRGAAVVPRSRSGSRPHVCLGACAGGGGVAQGAGPRTRDSPRDSPRGKSRDLPRDVPRDVRCSRSSPTAAQPPWWPSRCAAPCRAHTSPHAFDASQRSRGARARPGGATCALRCLGWLSLCARPCPASGLHLRLGRMWCSDAGRMNASWRGCMLLIVGTSLCATCGGTCA